MVILKLNSSELVTLSSFSKIKMDKNSPLIGHYPMEMINFNHDRYRKAYNSFIENGFLVPENDGYTLANELESAFLLLHKPEVTVSFKRLREINISEVCFTFKKGFSLQYIANALDENYILAYPHVLPSVGSWIRKELFVDLKFEGPILDKFKSELKLEELLILLIYMNSIKIRVNEKKEALNEDQCFISKDLIKNFNNFDEMKDLMVRYTGDNNLKNYLSKSKDIENGINSLVSKGLMLLVNDEISLTKYAKNIFDPASKRECFIIGEHLANENNLTTVNIIKGGYLILKTVSNSGELPKIIIEVRPPSEDIETIMKIAAPIAFSDGFGDEKKYENELLKQKKLFMEKVASNSSPETKSINYTKTKPSTSNINYVKTSSSPNKINIEKTSSPKVSEKELNIKQDFKFCSSCGTKLSSNANFCTSCGKKQ